MWKLALNKSATITLVVVLLLVANLFSATDDFENYTGPLNDRALWTAHTALQVQGGAVINTDPQNSWNYIGVYKGQPSPNDISMLWDNATEPGGVSYGGLVIVDNEVATDAEGYFIQYHDGEVRLWDILNGGLGGTLIQKASWATTAPTAGSIFQVKYDVATHTFQVYNNGLLGATLTDAAQTTNLTTSYGGILLHGTLGSGDTALPVFAIDSFTADRSAQGGDTTAPNAILDLAASTQSQSSISLTWTASGDDEGTGTATLYDIRRSTSQITNDTDFANATQVAGTPTPKSSGLSESMVINGLTASTTYYFALKVSDEVGNWSSISNNSFATTLASDGGSTITLTCDPIDDFERTDLGAGWATNNLFIENGELAVPAGNIHWNNFAIYTKVGAHSVSADFSSNNQVGAGDIMFSGLLVLADGADPTTVNGLLLLRRDDGLTTYEIQNGAVIGSTGLRRGNLASLPVPGDNIKAVIVDSEDGLTKSITFYVNQIMDATFNVPNSASLDDLFVGVVEYSGADNTNNLDNFQACYEGAVQEAENLVIISGDGQSGPIDQQLPAPIKVQVTNLSNEGVEGVLLDFQVTQGSATLTDIESFTFDGKLWREAEDGRILIPIGSVATNDVSASGEQYVTTSYTPGYRDETALEIPVYIPVDDTFDIWLRYKTDGSNRNGLYVSIDDGDPGTRIDVTNYTNTWNWIKCRTEAITKGSHKVNLIIFEPGWGWDKVLLQKAGTAAPSGIGGDYPDFPNVTDASGFAQTGVRFGTDAINDVHIQVSGEKNDGNPLTGSPVTFTLDPTSGPAAKMGVDYVETVTPGEARNLKVNVWDTFNNNVAGHTVSWEITAGQDLADFSGYSSTTSNTNGLGEAIATITVKTETAQGSSITVQASSPGLTNSPVTVTINVGEGAEYITRVQPDGTVEDRAGQILQGGSKPIVKVTMADGTPFPNYPVTFVVTAGGGTVGISDTSDSTDVLVKTDAEGLATINWKIGLGLNQMEARTPGLTPIKIVFQATGVTGDPANLLLISGDAQTGNLGIVLENLFVTKVTDSKGYAVSGEPVTYTITDGKDAYFGTVGNIDTTLVTDASGETKVVLTLGSELNIDNVVQAQVVNYANLTVTFKATPTGTIASKIQYESGNGIYVENPDGIGYWLYQEADVLELLGEPFKVKVLDPFDNPVSGQDVKFKVFQGGGSFNSKTEITVQSDADGIAAATLKLGTTAGDSAQVVQASAVRSDGTSTQLEGSPVIFKASGIEKGAEKLVKDVTTDNQQQNVGDVLTKPIRVHVEDIFGNKIAGHAVNFSVQPGNGAIVGSTGDVSTLQVATSDSGYASVNWKMPSSPPGQVFMQVNGLKQSGDPLVNSPMTFTAFATSDAADSMVAVTNDTLFEATVATAIPEQIAVKIVDRFGNPVSKIPVNFNIASGNGTVDAQTNVTKQTGDNGTAGVIWILGTKSGTLNNVLEVTASVPNKPLIRFKATAKPSVADSLKPDLTHALFGAAGSVLETGAINALIVDKYGNPVPNHKVIFLVQEVEGNKGYIDLPGQITKEINTNENGIAAANWYLGPAPGVDNNVLRATSKYNNLDLKGSPHDYVVSTTPNVASNLIAITDTTNLESITTNNLQDGLEIMVQDAFGNPIANHSVTFEVLTKQTAGGGSLDGQTEEKVTKATNSNGRAKVEFTLGNKAGIKNNQVRVTAKKQDETDLNGSPLIFYISGKSTNATQIAKAFDETLTGTVGDFLTRELSVIAKDQFGNNVAGQPITFKINPIVGLPDSLLGFLGDGEDLELTVTTGADGSAKAKWKLSPRVGTYSVDAVSFGGGQPLSNSPLTFNATANAGQTNALASTIQASPTETIVSTGTSKVQIIVTLLDQFANPVKGKAVTLVDKYSMGYRIGQPTQPSNSSGVVTGTISSQNAGSVWVFAKDILAGVDLADSAKVTFIPAGATQLAKAPVDNGDLQEGNIGTDLPNKLKVIVTDQFGNRIAGYPVTFRIDRGNGSILEPQPVVTDSSGMAMSTLRLGTEVGINLVKVDAPGLTGSGLQFVGNGILATNIAGLFKISGDSLTAAPGKTLSEPFVVQLFDTNGKPVWGENIMFKRIQGNGNIISNVPVMTNSLGMASADATVGTEVGVLNIYTATVSRIPSITATFRAWTQALSAKQLKYGAGSNQTNTVGQPLYQPFTVITEDDFGNPVANVQVKFEVINDGTVAGVGKFQNGLPVQVIASNARGEASAYYTVGTQAGVNKVKASSTDLLPNFINFQVIGTASFAYKMEKYSGDNQNGEMGKELYNPIQVVVKDQYGNPTGGGAVRFVATEGQGEITSQLPVISDESGVAGATWQLGPRSLGIRTNKALATATLPGGDFSVEFTATGDLNYYPIIIIPDEMTVYEGDLLNLAIAVTDQDGDQVFLDPPPTNLPDSSIFGKNPDGQDELTWNISYKTMKLPTKEMIHYPTFYARDSKGGRTKKVLKLTVKNVNRAPILSAPVPVKPETSLRAGQAITFSISAMDLDLDPITFNWTTDGNSVGIDDSTYTWNIPSNYNKELVTVAVNVSDGDTTSVRSWKVKVITTTVELSTFASFVEPYKGVTLEWATATEKNNIGFNIFRSNRKDGDYEKINSNLVDKRKDRQYRYIDPDVESSTTYYYKLEDVDLSGRTSLHGPVAAEIGVPKKFELSQNYPNPFNPTTSIRFSLPKVATVQLEIYNIMGQRVRMLVDDSRKAGYHIVMWDGNNEIGNRVGSGIYYYRIIADDFVQLKKMILIK